MSQAVAMDAWIALTSLATAQYGHVTALQARAAGFSDRTLRDMAARQSWTRPHPGVYRLPGAWPSDLGRLAAAALALGPPVAIARWSAAWLLGLVRSAPTTVDLLVPHDRRPKPLDGLDVRRTRTFQPSDAQVVSGLPCTTAVRTVCDLAAVMDQDSLRALIIDARQRRLMEIPDLAERAAGLGTAKGRRLVGRLAAELDAEQCDSVLEYRLRRRLAAVPGLPAPAPKPVPVGTVGRVLHVDIGWPGHCVGIEADGLAFHADRASLERDALRHNALERAGWRIVRATWGDLGAGFDRLVGDVTALLAQTGSDAAVYRRPAPRLNGGGVTGWR